MSVKFTREPRILSNPNIWSNYKLDQDRKTIGTINTNLYNLSGNLYIKKGTMGIDNDIVRGTAEIISDTQISLMGLSSLNWLAVECAISSTPKVAIITITQLSGATDKETLPTAFTNAYNEIKNGYYITSTKRCIGLVWIDEDDDLYIINCLSGTNGYHSNANYNNTGFLGFLKPDLSKYKNVSLGNIIKTDTIKSVLPGKWTSKINPEDNQWQGVCWSPELNLFCAVSIDGTNRVMTSPDGITWTARSAATASSWQGVCWSPELNLFCAVGTNAVMTSPDGVTWTARTPSSAEIWRRIAWSSNLNLAVAVSISASGVRVMTSPDCITWTSRSATDVRWYDVCWSPELNLFCAVSIVSPFIMTSPNGITWTDRTSANTNQWRSVCWSSKLGLFVAVSQTGTNNRVQTSSDGITWTARVSAIDSEWQSVCWSPELNLFCAVALSGTSSRIMISKNGITWTLIINQDNNNWQSICTSNKFAIFCSVSSTGTGNRIITSTIVQ